MKESEKKQSAKENIRVGNYLVENYFRRQWEDLEARGGGGD